MANNPRPLNITKKKEADMEDKPIYPAQFYKVKKRIIVINRTPALETMKRKQIVGRTIENDETIMEINLGDRRKNEDG